MTCSKILLLSIFVFMLLAPMPVQGEKAKAVTMTSAIEAVTVYRDRALVKRVSRSNYQPGIYNFKIVNLPLTLMDESVRVSGSGTAAAKILDIKIRGEKFEESASGRINELEKDQRELENQLRVLSDRTELLQRQDEFLRSLLKIDSADKEQVLQKKGITEWARMFEFLESSLGNILSEKGASK